MFAAPVRPEIDHRTIKLIVGLVALLLAPLTSSFASHSIESVSASYHAGGLSQTIFVGFLFAIATFLVAYNGQSEREMLLSKVAAVAALGIVLFPCSCGGKAAVPYVHGLSAVVMFLVLAYFCYLFYRRASAKGHPEAKVRSYIYVLCGLMIVSSILLIGVDYLSGGKLSDRLPRLVFYGEAAALVFFGISWLVASRVLPLVTATTERFSPLRADNPAS